MVSLLHLADITEEGVTFQGVGYPLDIVVCSALGADMYDCVYPTRTARFGTALVPEGVLKLKHQAMAGDTRPIDPRYESYWLTLRVERERERAKNHNCKTR